MLEHAVRGLVAGGRGRRSRTPSSSAPPDHAARAGCPASRWVREEPPGGGPVAGLAAAVGVAGPDVDARRRRRRGRAVRRGGGAAPARGAARPDASTGAIGADPGGRDQPLLAVYRVAALRAALAAVSPRARRLRDLVARLRVARVPVDARESLDLDTPADLEIAAELFIS